MDHNGDLIILSMIDKLRDKGSWCGETHLQKSMYFLHQISNSNNSLWEFVLYKHGPYSFDLNKQLMYLRAVNLVDYDIQEIPYGPKLKLTDLGKELLKTNKNKTNENFSDLDFICDHLATCGVGELERLATALYIIKTYDKSNLIENIEKLIKIKPHITEDQADSAFNKVNIIIKEHSRLQVNT